MLNQLLSLLFNKSDPNKAIKRRLDEHWQAWLKPITPEKPVGDDLTYNDNFQEIKEEVAKLSGIDYPLIVMSSETILKESSKDIRVATYYCLARLQNDGAEGFADGVELLAGLLDKFGEQIYPSRNTIRKNAIEWLANAKFTERLDRLQPIPNEAVTRIIAALNLIEQASKKIFITENLSEDEAQKAMPDLGGLLRFFVNNLKQPAKAPASEATSTPTPSENIPVEKKREESATIRSQRDLLDQARRMAAFLREKPEGHLAAGRFVRTLRWDTVMALPPYDSRSKTRIPAPRPELVQHINRLAIGQQWNELFERVEAAFMEGANHFWLDLQRYAVLALQKMGGQHAQWADIYLTDIGLMLERLKGIERLNFDNNMPFADDETLNWIALSATIHRLDEDASFAPIPVSGDNDWQELETIARELAQNEGLEKAFCWLQNLPALITPKQRFFLAYTQARVAEQTGHPDVAFKLLQSLELQQASLDFAQWEPSLLFDIKAQLLKLLKVKEQLKESNKAELMQQRERLTSELMSLDPARALAVIS